MNVVKVMKYCRVPFLRATNSANRATTIVAHACTCNMQRYKAVANGSVGQVSAGPVFLKVKTKFHFTKSK